MRILPTSIRWKNSSKKRPISASPNRVHRVDQHTPRFYHLCGHIFRGPKLTSGNCNCPTTFTNNVARHYAKRFITATLWPPSTNQTRALLYALLPIQFREHFRQVPHNNVGCVFLNPVGSQPCLITT